MRRVEKDGRTYAIIMSPEDFRPGVNFVSQDDWALQVGLLQHPAGRELDAHVHIERAREITATQEFLFVVEGEMEVDFYDDEGMPLQTEVMRIGEAMLQTAGGHGFRFTKPTRLIEVKQGPYAGKDADKRPIALAAAVGAGQ